MSSTSRKRGVLITGASGEMGTGLIEQLSDRGDTDIIALDLRALAPDTAGRCRSALTGDILDARLLERLQSEYEIDTVFHLAAVLSTRAEFSPRIAHDVNVQGTLNLLELAVEQSRWHGRPVRFLFPSSIAVYGFESLEAKNQAGRVTESQANLPSTMYGCNKLYCEQLGRYFASFHRQLAADGGGTAIDFRAIRFPGLISAETMPSGGTSDFAPEMLHAAAKSEPYGCFVREDTQIPFMTMPDGVEALLRLSEAEPSRLRSHVYNIGAFAPTAAELADRVRDAFPACDLHFAPDLKRQRIVDSWPAQVDDRLAREDWGFAPRHDQNAAFADYLVPRIRARYT